MTTSESKLPGSPAPDEVARLRALSAGLRGAEYAEVRLAAPYEDVCAVLAGMPDDLPLFIRTVRSFRLVSGTPESGRALAIGVIGNRAVFDLRMRPGWCLMQSRFVIGAMAAVPDGDGTRFAILSGLRPRALRPVVHVYQWVIGRRLALRFGRNVERRALLRRSTG